MPLKGSRVVGVKTRKTTGAGPFGSVTWGFGRSCRKTRMTNSERRIRFNGEAMDALILIVVSMEYSCFLGAYIDRLSFSTYTSGA